jgi:hypothetical protein
LFFERLLARPVPAPGGARGVNRHARFVSHLSRLAGGRVVFCIKSHQIALVIAGRAGRLVNDNYSFPPATTISFR